MFGPFNHLFPYSNFHDLNLDWVLNTVKRIEAEWDNVKETIYSTVTSWLDSNKSELVSNPGVDGSTLDFTEPYFPFDGLPPTGGGSVSHIKTAAGLFSVHDEDAMRAADLKEAVAEAVSGYTAPVFVASVSDMSDTDKIYVLTSNGHIYAYNGSWTDTGLVYGAYIAQDKLPVTGNPLPPLSIIARNNPLNTPGYYFASDGSQKAEASPGTYQLSPYIPVEPGSVLYGWLGTSTSVYCNFYTEQYEYISSSNQGAMTGGAGSTNPGLLNVPETAHYIRCTIPSEAATAYNPVYLVPAVYNDQAAQVFPSIGEFGRGVKGGWYSDDLSPVYYDNPDNIRGYINPLGRVMSLYGDTTYRVTPCISATPQTFYRADIGDSSNAYVMFLTRDMGILSLVSLADVKEAGGFTTPERCEFFRATLQYDGAWIARGSKYSVPLIDTVLDSLARGNARAYIPGVSGARDCVFSDSFDGATYTHHFNLYPAATVTVCNSDNNVKLEINSNAGSNSYTVPGTIQAGSLKNHIYVIPTGAGSTVHVTSESNTYTFNVPSRFVNDTTPVHGCYGSPMSPLWIFGDSYLTVADNRPGGHIDTRDAFVVSWSGAGPGDLADILRDMLQRSVPRMVVWLAGMNGENSANLSALERARDMAEQYGCFFMPATMPSVPNRIRDTYNTAVRAYDNYVEWAYSVQVSDQSPDWYAGLLDSDNIHPTEAGAIRLALEVVANVPGVEFIS